MTLTTLEKVIYKSLLESHNSHTIELNSEFLTPLITQASNRIISSENIYEHLILCHTDIENSRMQFNIDTSKTIEELNAYLLNGNKYLESAKNNFNIIHNILRNLPEQITPICYHVTRNNITYELPIIKDNIPNTFNITKIVYKAISTHIPNLQEIENSELVKFSINMEYNNSDEITKKLFQAIKPLYENCKLRYVLFNKNNMILEPIEYSDNDWNFLIKKYNIANNNNNRKNKKKNYHKKPTPILKAKAVIPNLDKEDTENLELLTSNQRIINGFTYTNLPFNTENFKNNLMRLGITQERIKELSKRKPQPIAIIRLANETGLSIIDMCKKMI